jgi:acyl carrier protein
MSGGMYDEVTELVVTAADGEVSREELDAAQGKLYEAGVASLYLVTIIDMLEDRYGVLLDPSQYVTVLNSVGSIVSYLEGETCATAS